LQDGKLARTHDRARSVPEQAKTAARFGAMEDTMTTNDPEIRALLDNYSAAIRAKDIDRLMSLYSPDIVYFDVVPPLRIVGAVAVRNNFLRWFDSFASTIGQDVRDSNIFSSGDAAVAYTLIRTSGTLKTAREIDYWVRATIACQRIDRRWLIAHEHISVPVDVASGKAEMSLTPTAL
jgi:uncharacterized protein (TIGR02246 family)